MRGTALMLQPHTIELQSADPESLAEFFESLAYILRARHKIRVTIE